MLRQAVAEEAARVMAEQGIDDFLFAKRKAAERLGVVDAAVGCGVESMSRVPLGVAVSNGPGRPIPKSYFEQYEYATQFEAAERIADTWDIGRDECDRLGLASQERAQRAWAEGRFEREVVPIDAPDLGEDGKPSGATHRVERDEGLRDTSLEALAKLKPVARDDGVHTAGTSSQITDGAAAILIMSRERADQLGLTPRARFVSFSLAGTDPISMLTGPIPATQKALAKAGLRIDDIDLFEVNEAFAAVIGAWLRETGASWDKVNVNGGAIALGHPLGASGARLMTTLLNELERSGGRYGLQTMCEGGGLANGTIIESLA